MATTQRTEALYQKDGTLHTYNTTISSVQLLSSLPEEARALFKPPEGTEPYILTTPSTIFHAQGGGQPTDTGTIRQTGGEPVFSVHQVRKFDPAILHMGTFSPPEVQFKKGDEVKQDIDKAARLLNSRLHTAGHVLGLAGNLLVKEGKLDNNIKDGKASHYPGAAYVEFIGLIPGTAKEDIQAKVDELVAQDLPVNIYFWTEEDARAKCTTVLESFKQDEDGVRVVEIGNVGSYPCGGTHVQTLKECGKIVVRNIKRQKGITKVSYGVLDA